MIILKRFFTFISVVLVLSPINAFAAANTAFATIDTLAVISGGTYSVTLDGETIPDEGCDANDVAAFNATLGGQTLYASLLATLGTTQQVQLRVKGCIDVEGTTQPAVLRVIIDD